MSTLRASFFVLSSSLLLACGDDSSTASGSGGGGGASTQSSAEGPTTSQGSGGEDGSGGDAASSSSSSSSSPSSSSSSSSSQSGPTSSSASTGSASSTSTSTGSCVPDCGSRVCGSDNCGGTCGECEGELVCSSSGACIAIDPGSMSFFITSQGNLSGDFGGIDGADAYCQGLAEGVGAGDRLWRAYVSTASEDARDRIGDGPWFDAFGATVAESVASLHADGLFYENALDESGEAVPNGKTAPGENEHDILTGSNADGTFSGSNCADFTSSSASDSATTGHCDASFTAAGGSSPVEPSDNWNSSHDTNGCDQDGLNGTGSTARLYCFAGE